MSGPALLTKGEVAAWLRIHPKQVDRLGVPYLALGKKTRRYVREDVEAWLATHRRGEAA